MDISYDTAPKFVIDYRNLQYFTKYISYLSCAVKLRETAAFVHTRRQFITIYGTASGGGAGEIFKKRWICKNYVFEDVSGLFFVLYS